MDINLDIVCDRVNNLLGKISHPNQALESIDLDDVIRSTKEELDHMETSIHSIVQRETDAAEIGCREFDRAKTAILDLFSSFSAIQSMVSQIQPSMTSIVHEVSVLDRARKNISDCIHVLKNIQMLGHVIERLEILCPTRNYKDMANIVQIGQQAASVFEDVKHMDRICILLGKYHRIKQGLEKQIQVEFEEGFEWNGKLLGRSDRLRSACQVIDVLGPDSKSALLRIYSKIQLRGSRTLIDQGIDACVLDFVKKKAWFQDRLDLICGDHVHIFPQEWNVCLYLYNEYSALIEESLLKTMNQLDASQIVRLKQEVDGFEQKLARYGVHSTRISDAVEKFMDVVIQSNERSLTKMTESFRGELVASEESITKVFPSCLKLVDLGSRCFHRISELSRNKPLADMTDMVLSKFRTYASHLDSQVANEAKKQNMEMRLVHLCFVINTCSYCASMVDQLEEAYLTYIAPKHNTVQFDDTRKKFIAMEQQTKELLTKALDPFIDTMLGGGWSCDQEEAEYVSGFCRFSQKHLALIGNTLTNPQSFKEILVSYCRSVTQYFLERMDENAMGCLERIKRCISEMADTEIELAC